MQQAAEVGASGRQQVGVLSSHTLSPSPSLCPSLLALSAHKPGWPSWLLCTTLLALLPAASGSTTYTSSTSNNVSANGIVANVTPPATAKLFYVSPSGNDSWAGTFSK